MVRPIDFRENYTRGDNNGEESSEYRKRYNGNKF